MDWSAFSAQPLVLGSSWNSSWASSSDISPHLSAVLIVVGSVAGAAVMVIGIMTAVYLSRRERERSRREIAAYVAEGTISAEEGERLLKASAPRRDCRPRRDR